MISVRGAGGSGAGSGTGRRSSSGTLDAPFSFAIRSATVTPSVWLPAGEDVSASPDSEVPLRSHGAAPGGGDELRVSQRSDPERRSPGVAFSPSLMSLVASDFRTNVRVDAYGRKQCSCLRLHRVAAVVGPAFGACYEKTHIVLRHPERR